MVIVIQVFLDIVIQNNQNINLTATKISLHIIVFKNYVSVKLFDHHGRACGKFKRIRPTGG